jgi:putative transposase
VNAGPETADDEGAEWEEACRSEEEIRRLVAEERSGGIGRVAVGEAAAKLGISVPSLYRLTKRFREDRRVSVLLPRKAGRPVGTRYISEGVEADHSNCYLVPERPPFRELVRQVVARCRSWGEQPPDARTIRSRVDGIDPFVRARLRHARSLRKR